VSGHPNLSGAINADIAQSERDGGFYLKDIPDGSGLEVQTRNTHYVIVKRGAETFISGHAKYCPVPTKAYIAGFTWGSSMLKIGFVGVGMHLEFSTDAHPERIVTTQIASVLPSAPSADDETTRMNA
jgi:hypothetical protein